MFRINKILVVFAAKKISYEPIIDFKHLMKPSNL